MERGTVIHGDCPPPHSKCGQLRDNCTGWKWLLSRQQ